MLGSSGSLFLQCRLKLALNSSLENSKAHLFHLFPSSQSSQCYAAYCSMSENHGIIYFIKFIVVYS